MVGQRLVEAEAAVAQPTTRYALAGDVNIAYQVIGDGPIDLVWVYGLASNIEVFWEEPSLAAFIRRLSEFTRLVLFDRRGCGASDRDSAAATPTPEERVDDVLAVLDAIGSDRTSIFGMSEGGTLAALFAATHPDRTASVILWGTAARARRDADHPWGWLTEDQLVSFVESMRQGWGTSQGADRAVPRWAPSMVGDDQFRAWLAKYCRQSVSRSAIGPLLWANEAFDLVDVFPAVRVPTLVLHRRDDALVPVSQARHIASQIPGAHLREMAGADHLPFVGDADAVLAEIQQFLVGSEVPGARRRRLLTLLVTDVADSTARLVELGDDAGRELLAAQDDDVRAHLARFEGDEVEHAGNGVLAAFDGPARAIRCALGIVEAAQRRGLGARAGVHVGECEMVDGDVRGVAVHVTSRLVDLAAPGQILVSGTVRDLVAGSGIRFGDARDVDLEGVPGSRAVLPVLRHGDSPETVRRLASEQANVFRLDGEYWTVAYDGKVVALRDSKGLRDIARLLARRGREIHVLDLAAPSIETNGTASLSEARAADLRVTGRGNQPVIDERARAEYRRRITELEQDLDEARAAGDGEAGAAARRELDALVGELTAAYGLGGRPRRVPDDVERARKAVTRRIRDAMGRVERAHPALGRHLGAALRTGVFCSYAPEHDVTWSTG